MSESVFITRTASYLPNPAISNDDMESVLGCAGDRPSRARRLVLRNNGIKSRHYVIDPETGLPRYTNAQLTAHAIRKLTDEQFALTDIQCLAVGTSTPDQMQPNHGVMVHGELQNARCEVVATSGICLSGTTALKYGYMAVRSGEHQNAVTCGSETASLYLRGRQFAAETDAQVDDLESRPELAFEKDFLRWMLSDAAGAILLQNKPNPTSLSLRIDWLDVFSYAHQLPVCMYAGGERNEKGQLIGWANYDHRQLGEQSILMLKQDVKLLNANVINYCLIEPLKAVREKRQIFAEQIDWFLPHMSSEYFREPMSQALEAMDFAVPQTRWFTNLSKCGNTGSASIYVMLNELFHSSLLQPGQRILCFVPESGRFSSAFIHLTVV